MRINIVLRRITVTVNKHVVYVSCHVTMSAIDYVCNVTITAIKPKLTQLVYCVHQDFLDIFCLKSFILVLHNEIHKIM